MSGDELHSLTEGVFVLPRKKRRVGPRPPQLGSIENATYSSLENAYQSLEQIRSVEQVKEISEWLLRCSEQPQTGSLRAARLPVALVQNLSASVQRELSAIIEHPVTVDCRGIGDIGGITKAVAVGVIGEAAVEAQRTGQTPIEAVCAWWERSSRDSPLLLHFQNSQTMTATVISDLVHVLNLHRDTPFRLLLSVPSIKTFMSTWPMNNSSAVDLHVLNGGRVRNGNSSLEGVVRASHKSALPFSWDIDERLHFEEDLVGGGAPAALKAMKWLLLHSRNNGVLRATRAKDLGKVRATLRTSSDGLEADSWVPLEKMTTVNLAEDVLRAQNPAPRLSTLHALGSPSAFFGATSDAVWNSHLSGQLRSLARHDAQQASTHSRNAAEAFPEIQALYNLWQASGKSVNLWDWLDSFRQAVVSGGDNDADDDQPIAMDDDTDSRLHALFIRFVEEARLFGTVRARGKNTAKRGDEVVKGVVMS